MIHFEFGCKILRRFASSSDAVGRYNGSGDQQTTKMSHRSFHTLGFSNPVRIGGFERSSEELSSS